MRRSPSVPGDVVIAGNHRRYVAMDACLRDTPHAIRTGFFAAAACVTHPRGGLGIIDGVLGRLVFTSDESAFLRFVHGSLAAMNERWFARLRQGDPVPGCEGLRGRDLDHALVELEQARFTCAMGDWFGNDDTGRARLIAGISETLQRHPLLRSRLLESRLRAALASARAQCRLDLGDEAQRCAVGHALVDLIRTSRAHA